MKINDYIIRRADNCIITHKDYGLDKTGSFRMDDTATYHNSFEEALRSVRRRLRNEAIKPDADFDAITKKLQKIDVDFIQDLKTFSGELAELMERFYVKVS